MKFLAILRYTIIFSVNMLLVSWFIYAPQNTPPSFSATAILPEDFGKTHFISGYDHSQQIPITQNNIAAKQKKSIEHTVLFAPRHDLCSALCELVDNETTKISIAIYTLTDKKIAEHLAHALDRRVIVEIVTEATTILDKYSKISDLAKKGAFVMIHNNNDNKQKGLMHNKFAIFYANKDKMPILWHGSFNFTRSGYSCNCESVIVLHDNAIINSFKNEFELIKKESKKYILPI